MLIQSKKYAVASPLEIVLKAGAGGHTVQQAGCVAMSSLQILPRQWILLGAPLKAYLRLHGNNCFKMETLGFCFFLLISVLACYPRICF